MVVVVVVVVGLGGGGGGGLSQFALHQFNQLVINI